MKKIVSLLVVLIFAIGLVSCGYSSKNAYVDDGAIAGVDGGDVVYREAAVEGGSEAKAGLMTAAAWNDNDNYGYWKSLFIKNKDEEGSGRLSKYVFGNYDWGFYSLERVKVTVTSGENPVAGAEVTAYNERGEKYFTAVSGADGVAYLFPRCPKGKVSVCGKEADFDGDNKEINIELDDYTEKAKKIKLMFVVDVTGSMGDELNYLENELADVVKRVAAYEDDIEFELALLFYRDNGDREKFAYHDFKNVCDEELLSETLEIIAAQTATGGGDYEEAVDEALELAMQKDWGEDNCVRLIFHILDAPPHSNPQNKTTFTEAVLKSAEKGIRICPLICSGGDELLEYLMREAAVNTGGTFAFVTDHSGIGGTHHDPELPNATVEKLNDLMVRLICGYYAGEFEDPVYYKS